MRIVSIVGARPQYIKLTPLHAELARRNVEHLVINTGQHYDFELAGVFFHELSLPKPKINLSVGSASTSEMVARILERSAKALRKLSPDIVVVYGDTNTTLGGALAAVQLNIPLAHVESGLRCFDLTVPEELNRVITDRISTIHFCPTPQSVVNLQKEGVRKKVYLTGDLLYDVQKACMPDQSQILRILNRFDVAEHKFLLMTVHRADTVDDRKKLTKLVSMISAIKEPIVFPLHPRTRKRLTEFKLSEKLTRRANIKIVKPCGYSDTLGLIKTSRMVLTDSGGIQREAYRLKVPTLLLREVTEWIEILQSGGSMLVGFNRRRLAQGLAKRKFNFSNRVICRAGASRRIAEHLSGMVSE